MTPPPRRAGGLAGVLDLWTGLSDNLRGAVWMCGAAFGFTLNGALVKALGEAGLHAFQIALARAAFSFAGLLPFILLAGPGIWRTRHPAIHLIRALAGGAAMVCGFYAFTKLPLAEVTALSFTTPLFATAMAVPLLGEAVRWRRWSATAAGFLGVVIMVRPGAAAFDPAALVALGMALGIAVAVVLVKRFPEEESHVAMLAYFSLAATLMTLGPAILVWRTPSAREWLLLVAIGLLGLVSQAMIIRAFRAGEASFVAPFDYSKLLLAGLLGFALFGELPDAWALLGAGVIVASTLYIARREAARRAGGVRR